MTTSRRFAFIALVLILSSALSGGGLILTGCGPPNTPSHAPPHIASMPGAVVHSLVPTGPGEIFGLKKDDVLVGWRRKGTFTSITSPLNARRVELEQAPAGELVLLVLRQGNEVEIPVTSGRWEIELRPFEPTQTIEENQQVQRLLDDDSAPEPELWLELSTNASARGADETARWYRHKAGRALVSTGQVELAQQAFDATRLNYDPPGPHTEAMLLELEGIAWRGARVRKRAQHALQRALDLRRTANPGSLAVAASLVQLAEIDPPQKSKALFVEAREIFARLAPASADLAFALNRLGNVAYTERNFDLAHERFSESLELRQRSVPGSYRVADSYRNLGSTAHDQGRLDEAERFLLQSLEIYPAEMSRPIAMVGNALGLVQRDKGNYRQARKTWEDSLSTLRSLEPGSAAVAGVLNNLGNLSLRLGDLDRAQDRYQESLALRQSLNPTSLGVASSFNNLGIIARQKGRFQEARRLMMKALELKKEFAPDTDFYANTLMELGNLATSEGKLEEAEQRLREALVIRLKIAPGSTRVAENLVLLGRLFKLAGRNDEAVEAWRQGLDLLDKTRTGFQFSAQERSIFASHFQEHYRDLARLLVEIQQPVEAFELLERSRARALRTLMGEELPAFDWPTIRRALDPGTRLIVYSVSENETLIAVVADPGVSGTGLHFHRLKIKRRILQKKVELFRALMARGRDHPQPDAALLAQGQSLFDLLLSPVMQEIEPAKRWVIIPDLPLNTLPFGALVQSDQPLRFVGEGKPISFVASGTLLALAKTRRREPQAEPSLLVYARASGEQTAVNANRSRSLLPLPGAGAEARRIAELFPGQVEILLDEQARESTLKARLKTEPRSGSAGNYLHFATHAIIDNRVPLDSALVLTPGAGEDGLLQAWEVIEQLRFDHDLVTLSACDTGLGRELGGEGVLGLAHAFLFSGAQTILTSLWPVSDDSTAQWMATFYGGLRRGVDRNEAVLEAQIQMKNSAQTRHPYYWAAFQLWGDWGGGLR